MSKNNLNKIIKFYKLGIYTKDMIDSLHSDNTLTDEEYEQVLASKE